MPAKCISINLFETDRTERALLGRLVPWITTYGRYVMVTTELVVLIAFISRFSLDRKLTDLKEEISQKQEILEVNQPLEKEIRDAQKRIKTVKERIALQETLPGALDAMHTLLPRGIYFESLSLSENKLSAQVVALTLNSFSQFLSRLSVTKQFTGIEISNINKRPLTGIQFALTAQFQNKNEQ